MAIIALLIGSLFYLKQMGFKTIGIYWLIVAGAFLLMPLITIYGVSVIQFVMVGIFFMHAKSKQAGM